MWFDVNKEFLYTPAGSGRSNSPISSYDRTSVQGVLLRTSRGVYVTQPSNLCNNLIAAVQRLNVEVAFTMSTELTNLIFSTITPTQTEFILPHDSTQYQILDSFEDMAKASSNKLKRFQYTCFVRKEKVVLLWHDDVESILSHGDKVERQLLTVVSRNFQPKLVPSYTNFMIDLGSQNPSNAKCDIVSQFNGALAVPRPCGAQLIDRSAHQGAFCAQLQRPSLPCLKAGLYVPPGGRERRRRG